MSTITQKECTLFHQWVSNPSKINLACKNPLSSTDKIQIANKEYRFQILIRGDYQFLKNNYYYEIKLQPLTIG